MFDLVVVRLCRLVVMGLSDVAGLFGVLDGDVPSVLKSDELLVGGGVAVEFPVEVRWEEGGLSGLLSKREHVRRVQHRPMEGRIVAEH